MSNLGLTKSQFEQIDKRLENITTTPVEEISIELNNPPTVDQLPDSNKSYSINCSVLFIDIRKSTDLSDSSHAKSMVKIYRSFMRMAVDSVRKNGGVTRQFLGDRIMGVFMDEKDSEGKIITLAVDKAIYCARTMQTLLDYSLNKHIYININKKTIECGIGISYGKVLVTQVGMRGTEQNEEKETEKDVVWVGKITNYASKYSDLAQGGEIFISNDVYKNVSVDLKKEGIWEFNTRSKSNRVYEGYIATNYYLDNKDDFGKLFCQSVTVQENQSENYLAEGIMKVDGLVDKLLAKERELAEKEEQFNNLSQNLKIQEIKVNTLKSDTYDAIKNIFTRNYLNRHYVLSVGWEFWNNHIQVIFQLGKDLGMSELNIKRELDAYLITVYCEYEFYHLAYEYLLIMAKYCSWLSYKYEIVIPNIRTSWELLDIIKKRINSAKSESEKSKFQNYYNEIEKLKL